MVTSKQFVFRDAVDLNDMIVSLRKENTFQSCPECEGQGYVQWGTSYKEIQECDYCEGHGRWVRNKNKEKL